MTVDGIGDGIMTASSKEYFESLGADWDRLQAGFFSDRLREKAVSEAGVQEGGLAADLGAGTGFITEALLTRGVSVVAVDQSTAMLDALRRKFPLPGRVDTRIGEAEDLPLDTASVDYAFANMYLHHVEDPAAAIAEMVRILKPGGRMVVTDLDTHEFEFLRTEQHDRWLGFEREDVRKWFREAGLDTVRVNCVGEDCCTESQEGEDAAISIFVASGTKPADFEKEMQRCC
jgi:ubiquinone/menaquinone biosynthesis C-methylase UbiE